MAFLEKGLSRLELPDRVICRHGSFSSSVGVDDLVSPGNRDRKPIPLRTVPTNGHPSLRTHPLATGTRPRLRRRRRRDLSSAGKRNRGKSPQSRRCRRPGRPGPMRAKKRRAPRRLLHDPGPPTPPPRSSPRTTRPAASGARSCCPPARRRRTGTIRTSSRPTRPGGRRRSSASGPAGQFFVYVLDQSGSMIDDDRLTRAKIELRRSVFALQPPQRFEVIFYNDQATPMPGGPLPRPADPQTKNQLTTWLRLIEPDGETEPRGPPWPWPSRFAPTPSSSSPTASSPRGPSRPSPG